MPGDKRFALAVALMLAIMGASQFSASLKEVQTWDEGIHLAAGYSYWKTGDYRMNPEHPPLFKLLCTLPLLALGPQLPLDETWKDRNQVQFGVHFMYRNRVSPDAMLFWGRSVTIALTLLLGLALAIWTRRRFGASAALIALFFFALDPNLIAHGHYVTNDLFAAAFIFLSCITWENFLRSKRFRDLLLAGLALSLALVSKFSAVFVLPVLVFLYWFHWWQEGSQTRLSGAHFAFSGAVMGLLAAAVICLVYWPETVRSIHGPALSSLIAPETFTSAVIRWFARRFHLPPHPYLLGLNDFAVHDKVGHEAYLLGMHSHEGWWYYFPAVFAVKTPTAVLLLTATCLVLGVARLFRRRLSVRRLRAIPLAWVAILVPPVTYFGLCMRSNVNLGVRHLLPVYPFLFVILGAALAGKNRSRRLLAPVLLLAMAIQVAESAHIYPDYIAFFNTPSGGPGNGPHYLVDSNIDWGQDLKKLRRYLDSIGYKREVCVCYFGNASMEYYHISYRDLPTTEQLKERQNVDCIAAISATPLEDAYMNGGSYRWLRELTPMKKVGYSIYLYDLRKK